MSGTEKSTNSQCWDIKVNKFIMLGKLNPKNVQCWESKSQKIYNVGKLKFNKFTEGLHVGN